MEMQLQAGGDQGQPITLAQPDSISARLFIELAHRLSSMVSSSH